MRTVLRYATVIALVAAPLPAAAAPKEPLRLKPSSPWNIHYADDSCRMMRSFGEGDEQVTLVADRFQPGDSLEITFIGKRFSMGRNGGRLDIRFGSVEAEQEVEFYTATMDDTPALMLTENIRIAPRSEVEKATSAAAIKAKRYDFEGSRIAPEQEAAATFIEVKRVPRGPVILETGSLGAPMKALRQCTDQLLTLWGIDVAKHASLSRKAIPKTNPGTWLTNDDYPPTMIAQGKRAIVHFGLDIDTTGAPTACHIQQSTRPEAFDKAVCLGIMRRAKFEPALDADGNPIISYFAQTVRFRM
jgi:TonB family protein